MRDTDEIMAYEARQQELVEGIVRSLYHAADAIENNDYLVIFRPLAKDLLGAISGEHLNVTHPSRTEEMAIELVNRPIIRFIGAERLEARFAEFRYLQMKVFEKVWAASAARITSEYQRLDIGL